MSTFIQKNIKRVAIIGGGPGGLAAARALRNEAHYDTITIYERNPHTGGTWKYSPETNPSPPIPSTHALRVDSTLQTKQLFSPIYANLHTNLPKLVMGFQDFPFPITDPLFLSHEHVMKYLTNVAEKEDLLPLVRFSTLVKNVEYVDNVWKVSSSSSDNDATEDFDAVVIATGHYAVPYIPDIPGLAQLDGDVQLLHSRDYRNPDSFQDKTVLVIGGGSSANDIVREISPIATKVYQSIRTQTELSRQAIELNPPNVHQISLLSHISSPRTIHLQDSSSLKDVDVIIIGTGYLYSFPFLPFQEQELITTGQKVHHLDHYMFYQKNPTLCFLGLPIRVVPMPLMQRQSIVMSRYWSGKIPMIPHQHKKESNNEDDRLDYIMGVAREIEYNEFLGAWAQNHTDSDISSWKSDDPVTGRLSDQWIELRKNALLIRRDHLGY